MNPTPAVGIALEDTMPPASRRACLCLPNERTFLTSGWQTLHGAIVVTAFALSLAGCAGNRAFSEGNRLFDEGRTGEGLAKLEEALRQEPTNAEYRIALLNRRSAIVGRLITGGDAARRAGRSAEAEQAYRQAQELDSTSAKARQGLESVSADRRFRLLLDQAELLLGSGSQSDLVEADERIRMILSEDPSRQDALNLRARAQQARTKAIPAEAKLGSTFAKPISLEFREATLKSVFDFVSKLSGLNVFFDKEVKTDQKVSVLAKNTSVEDAVRLLLVTNQLEKRVLNDNSILVFANTAQKLKEYQALSVRAFYLTNADVKAVSNTIKTIVKTKDMVIDERLGIIIIKDTPEAIRMAEKIVALQDLGDPEVVLEVEVLEIKRSRLLELGVQWPSQLSLTPIALGGGTVLTLADLRHLNSSSVQATVGALNINARKQDDDANILANPRIRVRNKEKAKVLIGDRVPVITTTSTSTGFVSESVNYVDVGLKLEVEPTIYLDEEVAIKINLEVSSLVSQVVSKGGTLAYQIGTRGANTTLRLKDGETQILAGLISDEEHVTASKVPGVGELPVVGRLFGSQNDNAQRGEILLSITPRVVRSLRRAALAEAEFDAGTEISIGADSLRLRGSSAASSSAALAMRASVTLNQADTAPVLGPRGNLANATQPSANVALTQAGSAPLPSAPTSGAQPTAAVGSVPVVGPASLSWQIAPQAKVGEQIAAVLGLRTQTPLNGVAFVVAYDREAVQLLSAAEGSFFSQNGGRGNFAFRVDEAAGQVSIDATRQSGSVDEVGTSGAGTLALLRFLVLKPPQGSSAMLMRVLTVAVEPPTAAPITPPPDQPLRIVP